jgi:L-aspartate oxidase
LASNSLLEGLVFGARAAQSMLDDDLPLGSADALESAFTSLTANEEKFVEDSIVGLQAMMWAKAGLLRQESMLREGLEALQIYTSRLHDLTDQGKFSRRLTEAQAICRVAHTILVSALARTESRGAHFRNDYPQRDDAHFRKHSILHPDGDCQGSPKDHVVFEAW